MAGLLDFLNSDDARLGMGLLAAGGPQTDPTKTGFGYALQSAMNSSDAAKQTALQRQLLQAQATEAQQKTALDAMNLKRMQAFYQAFSAPDPAVAPPPVTPNLTPTPTPGLLGATPDVGAAPAGPGTVSQPGGGSSVGPQPVSQAAASPANPLQLPGRTWADTQRIASLGGPDAYTKALIEGSGPLSDAAKAATDAGLQRGSPEYNAFMTKSLQKITNIPGVAVRGGGFLVNPVTNQVEFSAPSAIEGAIPTFAADGKTVTGYRMLDNAQTAIAGGQEAKDVGKAAATSNVAFDASNKPIFSTGLQSLQRAKGQAPTGNPADYFAPPTGGFAATGGNAPAPDTGPATVPGATIGMRNNNPGNLRPVGASTGFQQFDTPEAGISALDNQLKIDGTKHGINTIAGLINKYAPGSENDTAAYVKAVASNLGIDPNQKIDLTNAYARHAIASQIMLHENGPKIFTAPGPGGGAPTTAPTTSPGITSVVANSPNIPPPPGQDTTIRPQLPPGAEQAANSMQTGLTGHWKDLSDASSRANTAITQLQNIRMYAKQAILGTESGRLSYLNGILALGGIGAADTAKEASDALDKNRSQLISTLRLGAGQAGTDAFQTISDAATPGRQMNIGALNDAVDQLISQQRLNQAKTNFLSPYANTAARDPASFGKAELAFDNAADPRAFQLSSMAPDDAKAYLAKMPPDQKRELMTKVQQLEKMGAL